VKSHIRHSAPPAGPEIIARYFFGSTVLTDWQPGSPVLWQGEYQGRPYQDKGRILEAEPGRRPGKRSRFPAAGQQVARFPRARDHVRHRSAAAAELLGVAGETGTLSPGKRAGLVPVEGDPFDLASLKSAIRLVYSGGRLASRQAQ
jgi:hypothetical protein